MEHRPESPDSGPYRTTSRPPVNPPPAYPPPPPPGYAPYAYGPPPKGGSALGRAFVGIFVSLLVVSLLANVYLAGILFSMNAGLKEVEYQKGDAKQRIVILPINGLIDDAAAVFVRRALSDLRENRPVAVILRVDSGGGFVAPSDRIWHELVKFKNDTQIPVIASFGGLAASGGYYVAAPTDYIVAEPTCTTGSIGVMAQGFTIDQLLAKIGVTPEVLVATTSPEKDVANDIARAWTEKDRQVLTQVLDHLHQQFIDVVRQGRTQLTAEELAAVTDGRIFNADEALAAKLIDQVGYLDAAIDAAAQRANLASGAAAHVTVISRPQPLLGSLFGSHRGGAGESGLAMPAGGMDGQTLRRWMTEWSVPELLYLWQGR